MTDGEEKQREKEKEPFDRGSIEEQRVEFKSKMMMSRRMIPDHEGREFVWIILLEISCVFECLFYCFFAFFLCDIRWPHMGLFPISGLISNRIFIFLWLVIVKLFRRLFMINYFFSVRFFLFEVCFDWSIFDRWRCSWWNEHLFTKPPKLSKLSVMGFQSVKRSRKKNCTVLVSW